TGAVGMELVMSQHLQLVELRTPLAAALVMTPAAVGGFIGGPLAGRLMHRVWPPALTFAAMSLAAASAWLIAALPPVQEGLAVVRLLLLTGIGLGIGASVTFASTTIMNAAPPERGGMAASIEEVGFELGGSLGVALFGSLMTIAYAASPALPEVPGLPPQIRDSLDEAMRVADGLAGDAAESLRAAARSALPQAMRVAMAGVCQLWFATGLLVAGTRRPAARS